MAALPESTAAINFATAMSTLPPSAARTTLRESPGADMRQTLEQGAAIANADSPRTGPVARNSVRISEGFGERRVPEPPRFQVSLAGIREGHAEPGGHGGAFRRAELAAPHDLSLEPDASVAARRLKLEPHEVVLRRRERSHVE